MTLYQTRISVLWLMAVVALFGYANFAANEVNIEYRSNISLVTDQEVANVSVVMMALALLSLTLKGSTNRWTNLIGGSVVGFGLFIVLGDGVTVNPYGIYNLMMAADVIIMVSIIWFARKMPALLTTREFVK